MPEHEPLVTDSEVPVTGGVSKLGIQPSPPTTTTSIASSSSAMAGITHPNLPQDILDLIFASLCPPPPSQWIHGTVSDSSGKPRHAPSQPPDVIWGEYLDQFGDAHPVNTLLLGDTKAQGAQNPNYVEYKTATQTLAAVTRTCSWARELAERYLYRYVLLVRGRQLAGFVAAVEGRLGLDLDVRSARQGESEGGVGFSRLGRYVWGVYCFVDMMGEEDLTEWYRFELQLEEWNRNRKRLGLLQSVPGSVGGIGGREKEGGKEKKRRKNKEGKGKEKSKADGVSDDLPEPRKQAGGKEEEEDHPTPPQLENASKPDRLAVAGGSSTTKTTKASSSAARRNRRKKAQKTDNLVKPLDEIGTFFRLHSAMLDDDTHRRRGMPFAARNLYNLFLRLLLAPASGTLLPNLTDLLCSWYIIARVSGMAKEPDYLSSWIPGRVTLHPRPSALDKIKTFTIRTPVKHPEYPAFHDIQVTLGGLSDALPNLETFDTVFLSSCRSFGGWLDRPILQARETAAERELRLISLREGEPERRSGTHPLKHMRVYRTACSPATIAAFLTHLRPASLETLLVRFCNFDRSGLENYSGTILLGHEALIDNGVKDSLRYMELISTPSRHFLTNTAEMKANPRLRRLTCLPYLDKLEELVVDFQGLFGDIGKSGGLKEEDMDLLRGNACLPPNLETLKVICVWSSGSEEWFYTPPVGEYVISSEDVTMFVAGFWTAHEEGLLRLCETLRRLVLVLPDGMKRISRVDDSLEGIEMARERERGVIEQAGRYFGERGLEFVVERGMDVLNFARGN